MNQRLSILVLCLMMATSLLAQQTDSLKPSSIDSLNLPLSKADSLAADANKKLQAFETKEQKLHHKLDSFSPQNRLNGIPFKFPNTQVLNPQQKLNGSAGTEQHKLDSLNPQL